METIWLKILWHHLLGIVLLWLITEIWLQEAELKQLARGWARFLARQHEEQARVESRDPRLSPGGITRFRPVQPAPMGFGPYL